MAKLTLSLLGPFQAELDGQRIGNFRSARVEALLAYLAVEAERPHAREVLAALFWPDEVEATARQNLRQSLYQLRQVLGDSDELAQPLLLVTRSTVQFNRASLHEIDVTQFLGRLDQEQPAQALEQYRSDLLNGFACDSAAFEEWLLVTRERLHRLALDALHTLAERAIARGDHAAAQQHARRQLALEPWREEAHRQLMHALAAAGERTAALAQYDLCCDVLEEELGVPPADATTNLFHAIRTGDLALAPKRTSPSVVHQLPAPPTPFLGRTQELEMLQRQVADPALRLITVLGPGGAGKTRLAAEAARRSVPAFADGAYFVALATLADPALLPTTLAQTLDLALAPNADPQTQLLDFLRAKELLLVLDNFEQLVEGAELLAAILEVAPGVKLLVTSRQRLGLRSESIFVVGSFGCPPATAQGVLPAAGSVASGQNTVDLFLQSVRRVRPLFTLAPDDFVHLARICAQVDGLPLGIELAASWATVLSLPEIADEIEASVDFLEAQVRDLPERQRSLRRVLDHSWSLLQPAEQRALRGLAVFRGGFSRQAARAVADATLLQLATLQDKSLLQRVEVGGDATGDSRYALLELLRQYAVEQQAQAAHRNEARATGDRHAAYYLDHVAAAVPRLEGGDQPQALAELKQEIENIRAAWRWAAENGMVDLIGQALAGLGYLYDVLNWFAEGEQVFGAAADCLAALGKQDEPHVRVLARLRARQGWFTFHLGRHAASVELLEQSLDDLRCVGALADTVYNLNYMGAVLRLLGDYGRAEAHLKAALAVAEAHLDRFGASVALNNLGSLMLLQGRYGEAQEYCEASWRLKQAIGDRWGEAFSLNYLGNIARARQEYDRARKFYGESLAISHSIGDRRHSAQVQRDLGDVARALGDEAEARTCYAASLAIFRDIGSQLEMEKTLGRMSAGDLV